MRCTGDASFNSMWTLLHVPVINLPGFVGPSGMPVGLSLVAARYKDRHLLAMAKTHRGALRSAGEPPVRFNPPGDAAGRPDRAVTVSSKIGRVGKPGGVVFRWHALADVRLFR